MDITRLEIIDAHLEQARHLIDGVIRTDNPAQPALDSLCRAMEEMVAEWKSENISAAQTANRLSCLENGIVPD